MFDRLTVTALAAAVGLLVVAPQSSQAAGRTNGTDRADHDRAEFAGGRAERAELLDRIAVMQFLGPHGQIVRAAVVDALVEGGGVDVVPAHLVEARLSPGGSPWTHGAEIARELRLVALIHGETRRSGRGFSAALTLVDAGGRDVGRLTFVASTLAGLHGRIGSELWVQVRSLLDGARGASPAAPAAISRHARPETPSLPPAQPARTPPVVRATAPDAPLPLVGRPEVADTPARLPEARDGAAAAPAPGEENASERGSRDREGAATETGSESGTEPGRSRDVRREGAAPRECLLGNLELGGGVLVRAFNYREERRGALRGYFLSRAPLGRVEATLYPFARTCGVAGRLGVRLAYERMATIDSDLGGRVFSTEAFAYQAELVARLVLGRWVLTPAAGYHARTYAVAEEVVPRVEHHALGASLEAQRRVGILVLELGGGLRRLISAGDLDDADWFPGQTGTTYAGRLRVGGAMTDWLDLVLGLQVEYTAHDFYIQETGAYPNGVASGAYDTYLSTLLSVRLHLPGTTSSF